MTAPRYASSRTAAMPESVFAVMDSAKAAARQAGKRVVDLSLGSADLPPPKAALDALIGAAQDPSTYGYCLFAQTSALREAVASWTAERFGWQPDAAQQILPLIGSQEGMAHALFALCDAGDVLLLPDPGYPSYFGAAALAGLQIVTMPLRAENAFLPDLGAISERDAARARLMILSYPNNPTAAVATAAFMQEAVTFCHRHRILLVHDFPYVDLGFDGYRAPSVLTQPGALDVAIELYSASKSFNMGGFRLGWAVGNAQMLRALAKVKGVVDFNQYAGVQRAVVAALSGAEGFTAASATIFKARRDAFLAPLLAAGWNVAVPQASMYVWLPLPVAHPDSYVFCLDLLAQTGLALAPGRAFGASGEGYARVALVQVEKALAQAAKTLIDFAT